MPASEMSRLESYFHHSSLNMNYPVTMELPNHPARLRESGHVFLNTKRRRIRTASECNIAVLRWFS
jgi:hypothetical protein